MKRFAKICGWGALAIVLLFALILALSPVAKYFVNQYGPQIVGRQLHADRVIVNPYWGGVSIRGFECKEANGETNFVSFDNLYVQIAWPHLIAKRVTIRHIHLDGFNGQVLKANDTLNFSDIITRFASNDSVPKDTAKSNWRVSLNDIRLANSTIRYKDLISDKQWKLEDISLSVPGLYFDNKQTNAGLEFGLPTGGRVGLQAGYKMQSNRYAVLLNLYDVHSDVVLPLVKDYLDIKGLGAKINGNVHIDGSLDNITNIRMDGSLSMRGLSIHDNHNDEVAAMDELRIVVDKGDLNSRTFILDSLVLTGLTGNYEVHEGWNTLTRLIKEKEDPSQISTEATEEEARVKGENIEAIEKPEPLPTISQKTKPLIWMAKEVTVTAHDLQYHDFSMKKDWEYAVKSLRVDGHNVANNGRNSVTIQATLTSDAQLKVDYVGGLDMKTTDTRCNLKLTGVKMSDFSALCRNYTGYPLESGILSLESHIDVTGGQMQGTNHIVIDDPKVGKHERLSKAPYRKIPVRAGFNLLTSAQKMIVLDVPVSGDATNPKFNFRKVIGRAILKVFFGPLMGVDDKNKTISEEELQEMKNLIGEDTLFCNDSVSEFSANVAMSAGDSITLSEISQ